MARHKPDAAAFAAGNCRTIGELVLPPDPTHVSEADIVLPPEVLAKVQREKEEAIAAAEGEAAATISILKDMATAPVEQERHTLAVILDDLIAYQDTLEMAQSEDDRRAIEGTIVERQAALIGKADRYAVVMRRLEAEIEWEKSEAERHAKRRRRYEAAWQFLHDYAIRAMQISNVRKIEGKGAALKLRQGAGAVLITDEDAVPAEYKSATVTMPMWAWEIMLRERGWDVAVDIKASISISKESIKRAIKAGEDVPGADLVFNDSLILE